jgi:type II secretory pathway component PulF
MTTRDKVLALELWFFLGLPALGMFLAFALGPDWDFIYLFLVVIWCWELFAYANYRYCRQEEFLHVLQTAAATQAPVEAVLQAYLNDRPKEHLWRGILLFFVFPGYYLIHVQRSFDSRLSRLVDLLEDGVPLDRALRDVPGVVSREIALAVTIGRFTGQLTQALKRLPDRHSASQWVELAPRLLYPFLVLGELLFITTFLMIFVMPKFEKIMLEFKMKLPYATEFLIDISRWFVKYPWMVVLLWLLVLVGFNVLLFSSRAKWHCPLVGWVYRLHARGQFLRMLGLMLETGRPLPEILDWVLHSELLPSAIATRAARLATDLEEGVPLAESLTRHGLATEPMQGLIASAQKAQNLPWALEELGDSLMRRSARTSYRIVMVLFPLSIFACACLVGFVAVAMFQPLVTLIEGMSGG